jgi:SAM-dependent methyltransferase
VAGRFADVDAGPEPERLAAYLEGLGRWAVVRAGKHRRSGLLAFAGARVLDLGCGTGEDVREMGRLVGPRGAAVGVDSSAAMLERARGRIRPGDGPVRFVQADAGTLPFAEAAFDGVRIERVLQHVADPDGVIREAARILRPDGRLVIVEPDWGTLVVDLPGVEATVPFGRAVEQAIAHPRIGRTLRRRLVGAGFVQVEARVEPHLVTDPSLLGDADPLVRLREVTAREPPLRRLLEAWEAAVAEGRFLAALSLFEVVGRRPAARPFGG